MTNQTQQLPRLPVDALADFVNTTFATKQEITEAYVTAVHRIGNNEHFLEVLLASCIYKNQCLED